jgi:CrcB protein
MNAMQALRTYLIVALGGSIGSVARYWLGDLGTTLLTDSFPWGILLVNVLGCFVIGFFSEATGPSGMLTVSAELRSFVIIGICGGFTTFSAFSLGTIALLTSGHWLSGLGNIILSIFLCLIGVTIGVELVRFTNIATET